MAVKDISGRERRWPKRKVRTVERFTRERDGRI